MVLISILRISNFIIKDICGKKMCIDKHAKLKWDKHLETEGVVYFTVEKDKGIYWLF